jgi:hypothetical protein
VRRWPCPFRLHAVTMWLSPPPRQPARASNTGPLFDAARSASVRIFGTPFVPTRSALHRASARSNPRPIGRPRSGAEPRAGAQRRAWRAGLRAPEPVLLRNQSSPQSGGTHGRGAVGRRASASASRRVFDSTAPPQLSRAARRRPGPIANAMSRAGQRQPYRGEGSSLAAVLW